MMSTKLCTGDQEDHKGKGLTLCVDATRGLALTAGLPEPPALPGLDPPTLLGLDPPTPEGVLGLP